MSKIKVIKKNELLEQSRPSETNDANSPPKVAERGVVETIENWIADWRKQAEIKTRIALGELAQLKLKNSIGI